MDIVGHRIENSTRYIDSLMMDISDSRGSAEDEKIRKALSHFQNAEFYAKLDSSLVITAVVRSFASKVIHLNMSKDGILLVGQVSQESQMRAHLPSSLFEEYRFSPSSNCENLRASVESRILLDCLTLPAGNQPLAPWKTSGSRRRSIGFYNKPDQEDLLPNLSSIGAEVEEFKNRDDATVWLFLTRNTQNLVLM